MRTDTAVRSDLDTLRDLRRDYIGSVQTSDVRRLGDILAHDFLCSNPDGTLMGDVAIIHARSTYTPPNGRPAAGRYTDVWARRHGRWLAVSAHVTRC